MAHDEHRGTGINGVAPKIEARPWHREPLVWMVIALPAAAVVAGLVTLWIAVSGRDDVVRDDFRQAGRSVHPDPRRDNAAVVAGVRARVALDGASGQVSVDITLDRGPQPDGLVLILSHATRSDLDRLVRLEREGDAWQGSTARFETGHWYVEVTPSDRAWRLTGDFKGAAARLQMEPGLVP